MKHIVLPSYSIRAGADLHGKVSIFGYSIPIWVEISDVHTLRVVTDLGSVRNENLTKTILEGLIENDLYDNTLLLFSPETGIKTRVSGTDVYLKTGYSLQLPENDLVQNVEAAQPEVLYGILASFDGVSQHIISPLDIYDNIIVAVRFSGQPDFEIKEDLIGIGDASGTDLYIGSNKELTAFYNIEVKAIVAYNGVRNQGLVDLISLLFLNTNFPFVFPINLN